MPRTRPLWPATASVVALVASSALAADPVRHAFIADEAGRAAWTYPHPSRDGWVLDNGNVLLALSKSKTYPGGAVAEVGRDGKVVFEFKGTQSEVNTVQLEVGKGGREVWRVSNDDLPGKPINDACGVQRLENGNTVIASHHATAGQVKLLEVTRDRKVVWTHTDDRKGGIHHFQVLDAAGKRGGRTRRADPGGDGARRAAPADRPERAVVRRQPLHPGLPAGLLPDRVARLLGEYRQAVVRSGGPVPRVRPGFALAVRRTSCWLASRRHDRDPAPEPAMPLDSPPHPDELTFPVVAVDEDEADDEDEEDDDLDDDDLDEDEDKDKEDEDEDGEEDGEEDEE